MPYGLTARWCERARKIDNADDMVRRVEQSTNPSLEHDAKAQRELRALPDDRAVTREADEAIRGRMGRELASEVPRLPGRIPLDEGSSDARGGGL